MNRLSDLEKNALASTQPADLIVITDPLFRITWVNDAFCRKTGYSPEDCADKCWPDLLRGVDTDAAAEKEMMDKLRGHEHVAIQHTCYTSKGISYQEKTCVSPLFNHKGELSGFISSGIDTGEQKQIAQAINKLLTNISGLLELSQSESESQKDMVRRFETLRLLSGQLEAIAREMNQALSSQFNPEPERHADTGPYSEPVNEIWIVDDDEVITYITRRLIRSVDPSIRLVEFLSARMALEKLRLDGKAPGIILLDINMPGLSGWEFLDSLNRMEAPANVYMYSASIDPEDVKRARTYPIVRDFLPKPLDLKIIQALLNLPLEQRKVS